MFMSDITIFEAPLSLHIAETRRPTAPAPRISTELPGPRVPNLRTRRVAWIATERGSRRAAAVNETLFGSLRTLLVSQSGVGVGEEVLVTPPRWMVNLLLESSPVMRVRLSATPELHPRADIIPARTALPTLATRDADLQRDSIPNTPFLPHTLSHRCDHTRRLMPED